MSKETDLSSVIEKVPWLIFFSHSVLDMLGQYFKRKNIEIQILIKPAGDFHDHIRVKLFKILKMFIKH